MHRQSEEANRHLIETIYTKRKVLIVSRASLLTLSPFQ